MKKNLLILMNLTTIITINSMEQKSTKESPTKEAPLVNGHIHVGYLYGKFASPRTERKLSVPLSPTDRQIKLNDLIHSKKRDSLVAACNDSKTTQSSIIPEESIPYSTEITASAAGLNGYFFHRKK